MEIANWPNIVEKNARESISKKYTGRLHLNFKYMITNHVSMYYFLYSKVLINRGVQIIVYILTYSKA